MKVKLVSSLLLMCGVTTWIYPIYRISEDVDKKIKLEGRLGSRILRSSYYPFCVTMSPFLINITYLKNMRDIGIEVLTKSGESKYHNTVDPTYSGQHLINITSWEEGNYSIIFSDKEGKRMFGTFEIFFEK